MNEEHKTQCRVMSEVINTKIKDCVDDLKSHIVEEEKKVNTIHDDIKNIKENHLAHIQIDLAKTSTNVDWLLKYHWIVATASVGGLVAGLFNLME